MIERIPEKLERDSYIYRVGVNYKNVIPNKRPIVFYFEAVDGRNANKDAIETIKIAIAEVEWNYPMDYAIAFEAAIEALEEKEHRCNNCDYAESAGEGVYCILYSGYRRLEDYCSEWERR